MSIHGRTRPVYSVVPFQGLFRDKSQDVAPLSPQHCPSRISSQPPYEITLEGSALAAEARQLLA